MKEYIGKNKMYKSFNIAGDWTLVVKVDKENNPRIVIEDDRGKFRLDLHISPHTCFVIGNTLKNAEEISRKIL